MRIKVRDTFALHKANTMKFAYERIYGNLFTIFEEEETKNNVLIFRQNSNVTEEESEEEVQSNLFIFTQQSNVTEEEEEEEEEIGAFILYPTQVDILNNGVLGGIAEDASYSLASSSNI